MSQKKYKSHYEHLKNKWTEQSEYLQKILLEKHKESFDWLQQNSKQFIVGSMGGLIMFSNSLAPSIAASQSIVLQPRTEQLLTDKALLVTDLSYILPEKIEPLTEDQEKVVGQTLSRHFGFHVSAALQGKRLDRSYGLIGAEQHLMRYPGDMVENMASGRGAWGYFAQSRESMTEIDMQREQWYIAVQTFLAPGYNDHIREYTEFFKYRKMLVVNPQNGKAVVAVIGDAGPAPWTGKHLGGSPEVMHYLERVDGRARGSVLYFFVDDPDDTIPLGPVQVK